MEHVSIARPGTAVYTLKRRLCDVGGAPLGEIDASEQYWNVTGSSFINTLVRFSNFRVCGDSLLKYSFYKFSILHTFALEFLLIN